MFYILHSSVIMNSQTYIASFDKEKTEKRKDRKLVRAGMSLR